MFFQNDTLDGFDTSTIMAFLATYLVFVIIIFVILIIVAIKVYAWAIEKIGGTVTGLGQVFVTLLLA